MLIFRGGFWRIREEPPPSFETALKRVTAVIPARDEAAVIAQSLSSLVEQDYRGDLSIVVADDHSSDGTAAIAHAAGAVVIPVAPLPSGWTGKLWALDHGLRYAQQFEPDYFLFTDADIVHAPDNVRALVARAESDSLDMASLMVQLHCRSLAERVLIPAFVYFFFQLYPPRWIADQWRSTAGAAGGCMLIRPAALARIGGIDAIRGELIDDCALAARVKQTGGKIWLGVTQSTHSVREYATFREIFAMISRTAFNQLHHSLVWLAATIFAITILYLLPPFLPLRGGLAAWILMTISYVPILRFYRQPLFWAPLLPVIAIFYMAATIHSSIRYWTGSGGVWKGRAQDVR